MRYLRYYIQVGHERASLPMSAAQTEALQRVESLLRRASLRIEFELSRARCFLSTIIGSCTIARRLRTMRISIFAPLYTTLVGS